MESGRTDFCRLVLYGRPLSLQLLEHKHDKREPPREGYCVSVLSKNTLADLLPFLQKYSDDTASKKTTRRGFVLQARVYQSSTPKSKKGQ